MSESYISPEYPPPGEAKEGGGNLEKLGKIKFFKHCVHILQYNGTPCELTTFDTLLRICGNFKVDFFEEKHLHRPCEPFKSFNNGFEEENYFVICGEFYKRHTK